MIFLLMLSFPSFFPFKRKGSERQACVILLFGEEGGENFLVEFTLFLPEVLNLAGLQGNKLFLIYYSLCAFYLLKVLVDGFDRFLEGGQDCIVAHPKLVLDPTFRTINRPSPCPPILQFSIHWPDSITCISSKVTITENMTS